MAGQVQAGESQKSGKRPCAKLEFFLALFVRDAKIRAVIRLIIGSQKGGVGKTTLSVNLAYAMARRGWKVLLMDTDPQGGVGLSLSRRVRGCNGFYDALVGGAEVEGLILSTRLPELKIFPAGRLTSFFQLERTGAETVVRLERMFRTLETMDFDLVMVDTAAGLYGVTNILLRVADYLLTPQQAEPLALRSIPQLLHSVAELRRNGTRVQLAGIILTMLSQDNPVSLRVSRELAALLPPGLLLEPCVPRDSAFLEASDKGMPLSLLQNGAANSTSLVFEQLAAEVESRIGLQRKETSYDEQRAGFMD